MSKQTALQLKQALARRELARRRLLQFTKETHGAYSPGWVHDDICRRLERFSQAVAEGRSPRLMLLMPPRHGKSEIASIRFPAWHLGKYPSHEIINVGYNTDLPMKFSRKVRETMRDPLYKALFPKSGLDPHSQSVEAWYTTVGGGYTAAGVGGGITGKGAHCVSTSTQVCTRKGVVSADEVRVGDEVLGYDHETKRACWTPVLAVAASCKPELVSIGDLECTPDHRVWTENRGYVHAGDLGAPDRLVGVPRVWSGLRAPVEGAQALTAEVQDVLFESLPARGEASVSQPHLPVVRREEGSPREAVRDVPRGGGGDADGHVGVRVLPQAVHAEQVGVREVEGSARQARQGVLHALVLQVVSVIRTNAYALGKRALRYLSQAAHLEEAAEVLFSNVLPGQSQVAAGTGVPGVSGRVVARPGGDHGPRQAVSPMHEVRDDRGAPHRSRRYESRADEFDRAMSDVPLRVSCQTGVRARDLEAGVQGTGHRVVDLQTGTENFFAGGLLVHNCLIVDDPIKNQEEADSIGVRDKLWDWYQSTAYTRLAPGGGVLVIETWWNDDDLAGRLQEAMRHDPEADQFEVVKYPALSTQWEYRDKDSLLIVCTDDPLSQEEMDERNLELLRPVDFCLHEDRYPTDALKRIRANLQPRIWSALYQQNPVPDEGMYFKREYFKDAVTFPSTYGMRVVTAWDFAITEKQTSDWTVGVTLLQDYNDVLYVLDVHRFKGDSFDIVEAMLDVADQYGSAPNVDYVVGAEDGQIWRSIEPLLNRRMSERRQFPSIKVLRPITDKMARARPLQGRMQQHRVIFPQDARWKGSVVSEMLRFPAGAHDDVVDALAWAVRLTMEYAPPQRPAERTIASWKDRLNNLGGSQGSHMTA